MNINQLTLSGNLTRDAECRYTKNGNPVLVFCIAVNDRVRNSQTEEWEDYANFFDCVLFGSRAEKLVQMMPKGTKVSLNGKLRFRQYVHEDTKRSKIDVIVNNIDFYVSRDGVMTGSADEADTGLYDEDVPF